MKTKQIHVNEKFLEKWPIWCIFLHPRATIVKDSVRFQHFDHELCFVLIIIFFLRFYLTMIFCFLRHQKPDFEVTSESTKLFVLLILYEKQLEAKVRSTHLYENPRISLVALMVPNCRAAVTSTFVTRFETWWMTFIDRWCSLCCDVLHCLNVRNQVLLMPSLQCCQCDAVQTALLHKSGTNDSTNESE